MHGLYRHLVVPSRRSVWFMQDFAAGDKRTRLKVKTGMPTRETVHFDGEIADVYRPQERVRAGIVLIPGVARECKDDPRMVRFATTIARMGFGVVVPELSSLRDLIIRGDHYKTVVKAYRYLLSDPSLAPRGRAGIGGFSFAMGPGLLAAIQPEIREQVRFLFCIGGFYDMRNLARFLTTSRFRGPDGQDHDDITADHYGRWVLARSLVVDCPDEGSREAIRAMVDRKLPDAQADVSDLEPLVTEPGARALLALVQNSDPERFDALMDALPAAMRDNLLSMDLANRDLADLHARLILVHGYEDTLVPYTESQTLFRRARRGNHKLYLVKGLSHVTMGKMGPIDVWALLSSVTELLREQER